MCTHSIPAFRRWRSKDYGFNIIFSNIKRLRPAGARNLASIGYCYCPWCLGGGEKVREAGKEGNKKGKKAGGQADYCYINQDIT